MQSYHEIAILALLFERKELVGDLDSDFFEDSKTRDIFYQMKKFIKRNKEVTTRELSLLMGKDYNSHMSKLRKFIREPPKDEVVLQMLGNKMVKKAILEVVPSLSKLNLTTYEKIKSAISTAENLNRTDSGSTVDSYNTEQEIFKGGNLLSKEYPSFLEDLYLHPGEVGLIQALPKGGKTLALTHIGSLHLIHGMKVYHWSLEIPKNQLFGRYAGRLTGDKRDLNGLSQKQKFYGGHLVVRDEPYCTMNDIRSWALQGRPDMLILDYADLIIPATKMKERRFEIREVYLAIRNLAKELHIPIWTASQSTVSKAEKKVLAGGLMGMDDLEEAKAVKAGICALILSLNQTLDEKEDGLIRIFIALSTHGYGRAIRPCEIDYQKQYIKEMD